jgi:hypothetical protein
MSLFDRYDQNKSEIFLRHTCFVSTPQKRFEDLFEQIHQHFSQTDLFSSNEISKNLNHRDHLSMDRLILHDENINDLFLESISHLLVFNLVKNILLFGLFLYSLFNRMKIHHYVVVRWMH